MSLLIFLLALIHCLVQGVESKQLSVGAKLDWKHVLSLPSEGPAYHDWKQKTQELMRGRPFSSYDRHIPILGVGLNNDPFSLLLRLFYSIDYPIDKIVLLTGSSIDEHVQRELDHITRHFKNVVVRQGHSTWLGVAESWNAIMMEVPDAPWVFIVSMDIEFAPGSLQRLAHHAWEDWDKKQLDQAFIEYCNDGMSGGYSAFVMSRSMISKLGFFDENIFPAYYEDTEYDLRVRKYNESTGLSIHRQFYGDVVALHGLPTEHGGVDHRGVINAMSKQVSAVPKEKIFEVVNLFIQPYITKKWGCNFSGPVDWTETCTFATPFNVRNNISFWQLDKWRRAEILHFLSKPTSSVFLLYIGCSFFMMFSVVAVYVLFLGVIRRNRLSAPRVDSHKDVGSSHV
eukprot:gene16132-22276_t